MTDRVISCTFAAARGWEHLAPDAVIWIDVQAFDRAWRLTDQYIVTGGGNGQDDRYANIARWFAGRDDCEMPSATINEGEVSFTNGRHRFSWLRDQGAEALPFQVDPDLAEEFAMRFGAKTTPTVLRDP